jgi:membrane protease YdiL (CAAX protease family)
LLWNLGAYGGVACIALLALLGLYQFIPEVRRRWLPLRRFPPVSWTGREVFLVFVTYRFLPELIVGLLLSIGFFQPLIGPRPDLEQANAATIRYIFRCMEISGPLTLVMMLIIIFTVLYARTETRPHHYGLSWARWPGNIATGLTAFVLATPVVLGVYLVLALIVPKRPQMLEILGKQTEYAWEWILFGFQTLLMAPLLEEILFRGILQGWLRRATLFGHLVLMTVTVSSASLAVYYHDEEAQADVMDPSPLIFAVVLAAVYGAWMFRLVRTFALQDAEVQSWQPQSPDGEEGPDDDAQPWGNDPVRMRRWVEANAALAVYGSAMLFAVGHSLAWPAPVPLFVMGLILGWLSQRSQSLLGTITFHALFNLVAFIVLFGTSP